MPLRFDKIIDAFMFREGSDEDSDTNQPVVTTGSIVWGLLIRTAIIIIASMLLLDQFQWREYWWVVLFAIWLLAAWPAYRQYQKFSKRMENFESSTLCGSCRHFDPSSQLCTIYDEHVSTNHIPCGGDLWEPKDSYFDAD
ncbi:MAG: hypothetical protein ACLFQX_12480 [Candidatus Kapaibacterium sp.]